MNKIICQVCKKYFLVKRYRIKTAKYCSRKCLTIAFTGICPQFIPIITKLSFKCENCGIIFKREKSRLKYGRAKNCSKFCQYKSRTRNSFKLKIKKICNGCGTIFYVFKSKNFRSKYCNLKCRNENRIGKNHPQFLNGISSEKRGPNWQSQRRKAKQRDKGICQNCFKIGNDVHHIIPFRIFGIMNYKKANNLLNLITLCKPCHRKADSKQQKQDKENVSKNC